MASDKTNVMRVLEQHKITYKPHEYPHGKDAVDGVSVAELLGQNPDQVFKTLVARGKSGGFQGTVGPYRLCTRRLLAGRHEEGVPDRV